MRAPGQVGDQGVLGRLQPVDADVLLAGVGELRVAGAVVDGGDAEGGEPGDVGPAELGPGRPADGGDERGRGRLGQARQRAAGVVDDGERRPGGDGVGEDLADVRLGGVLVPVGREAEVDRHRGTRRG